MSLVTMPEPDSTMERLDDQISWYDRKSLRDQSLYRRIKAVEIVSAALIPFLVTSKLPYAQLVTGCLGVLITVLEGLLHLNQYQQTWLIYRSTCEALKHEKYTYLARAGAYASAGDPHALLAERSESLISQEHAKWTSIRQDERPTGKSA